jgi:hypothetical protein
MNSELPSRTGDQPAPAVAQRDAYLHAALRHAPDLDQRPPAPLSESIRRAAHEAAAARKRRGPAGVLDRVASWFDTLVRQPSLATGLAGVMVATVVGLMWWDESLPPAVREAPPPAAPAPEPTLQAPATAQPSAATEPKAAAQRAARSAAPVAAVPAPATMAERPRAATRAKEAPATAPALPREASAGPAAAPAPGEAEASGKADARAQATPALEAHSGTTAAAPATPAPTAKSAPRLEAPAADAARHDTSRGATLRQPPAAAPAGAVLERHAAAAGPPPLPQILRDPPAWLWQAPHDAAARPLDAPVLARLRSLAALPWQRHVGELPAGPRVRWLPVDGTAAAAELVVGERQAVWLTPEGQRSSAEWSAEERDRWR